MSADALVAPDQTVYEALKKAILSRRLPPGTKLITQPQTGNKASLIVTPESKQNFISADIVEGFPKRVVPLDWFILNDARPRRERDPFALNKPEHALPW